MDLARRPSGATRLAQIIAEPEAALAELSLRLTQVEPSAVPGLSIVARAHGVEAWLAEGANATPGLDDVWRLITDQRPGYVAARARAKADIRRFSEIASHLGCEWVVIKGQAIAESCYPRPHMRHSVDVDVLIAPSDLERVTNALIDAGWGLLDRNWGLLAATRPGQLRLLSPTGGVVDLHWHLLNSPELRDRFRLGTADLLSRGRMLESGLPALSDTDQLLHLCLHAALAGGNRLLWLVDASLASHLLTDPDEFRASARASGTDLASALVLRRAAHWLRSGSATNVLKALHGVGGRGTCLITDRVSAVKDDPFEPALARAFARSVRESGRATVGEFSRHLLGYLAGGGGTPLSDPSDVRSPMFDDNDPVARAAYFSHVRSQ